MTECVDEGLLMAYLVEQGAADGVYLFNFFTTREHGAESWEPPFGVLRTLGSSPEEADPAPARSLIGYTEFRTDLPGG